MDILQYTFVQNALLGSLLTSIICGMIGTYIVTRRLVFITGGITHASFGGVGFGVFTGLPPVLSAAIFAVLSAFGIQWLSSGRSIREDSAIAVVWALGMSLGILFCYLSPEFVPDLSSYLFGNILAVTHADILLQLVLVILIGLLFIFFLRPIQFIAFDTDYARSQHLPVKAFEYILMALIGLTIVSTLRLVGIVLAISLLTVPQMTANIFTQNYKKMIGVSILVGFVSCMGGLFAAFAYNIPSGAAIIFVSICIYLFCKFIRYIFYRLKTKEHGD